MNTGMRSSNINDVNFGRVMVLGSRGMVGSAFIREIGKQSNVSEIIPVCREQVDLTDQTATFKYIAKERPDWIIVAAAKVGGIYANNAYKAEFIYQNLALQNNVIEGAFRAGVEKLVFLGSSCIYPRSCPQPIKEEYLLTGPLEITNEPYALAKIAGIKMCESYCNQYGTDYRTVMPTNLYGTRDNYDPENSHVIPGLIQRFHEAKISASKRVSVWGSGKAKRDFLYVDDLVKAIVILMELPRSDYQSLLFPCSSHVNVGSGSDLSIAELAKKIKSVVGFAGEVVFDTAIPDGTGRKLLDISKILKSGWRPETDLQVGLSRVYEDFKARHAKAVL